MKYQKEYLEEASKSNLTPMLDKIIAKGENLLAHSAIPSFTNPNNISIVTGQPSSVHGICGAWGVLAVAFFDTSDGLLYGGTSLFVPQIIGILAIGTWAFATSYGVLKGIDSLLGLRVTPEEEIAGLDASEHGTTAYGDFILKK